MRRDLAIALFVSALLHGGVVLGDRWFAKPTTKPAPEPIPVIALTLPPIEPDEPAPTDTGNSAPADTANLLPPMQADVPSARIDTPFVQPLTPPAPPNATRSVSLITLPSGTGFGTGVKSIFDLADLDEPPEALLRIKPDYPYDLLRAGITGEALLELTIDPAGNVRDIVVVSATQREFGEAARQAVARWKFKPGKVAGRAVSFRRTLPITFTIGASP